MHAPLFFAQTPLPVSSAPPDATPAQNPTAVVAATPSPTVAPIPTPAGGATTTATATPSPTPVPPITISQEAVPWTLFIATLVGVACVLGYKSWKGKSHVADRSAASDEGFFRNEIARTLLYSSIGGIVLLGALIVLLSFVNPGAGREAKIVFDSLLPVFGTWVGTLLAFYFSKENFEAATKSVTEIAKGVTGTEKLSSLRVTEKMRRTDQIATLPAQLQGKTDAEVPLSAVVAHLGTLKLDRLPLFEGNKAKGRAKCVVHLSNIHRFLARKTLAGESASKLMLSELIGDPDLAPVFKRSFSCVAQTCTLADAKTAMDNQSKELSPLGNCYDVFVTASGAETEDVIGWITNDIINENSKV